MKLDLLISGISDTRKMGNCPESIEAFCGINYRAR